MYNERRQLVTEYSRARCDTTHAFVVSPTTSELTVIRVHRGQSTNFLPHQQMLKVSRIWSSVSYKRGSGIQNLTQKSVFISFHAIIFKSRTAVSQTNQRESRIWREISIYGHSKSCILGSLKSRRGTPYRHIIMLALLLNFVMGSIRRTFCAIECITAVQGHQRSLILAPNERACATSY